jgi:hypothetical protein
MSILGKTVFVISFGLALVWTFALYRIAYPKRLKPVRCVHRWTTVTTYQNGHKKRRCSECGAVRLFVPSFRQPWF